MYKKLALFVLAALILKGCSSPQNSSGLSQWMSQNGKIKVLSTTAMIDDLVAKIGGERVDHIPLIIGDIDPHSYELVKGDSEKLTYASLIFFNGLGLEHGASLQQALQSHKNSVSLGDHLLKVAKESLIIVDGAYDPHIWMDASLFAQTIDPIVAALSSIDEEGRSFYEERAAQLKEELKELDQRINDLMRSIPKEKRYLVTSHDAFHYFAKRYLDEEGDWQERIAAPEGLAPDGQLSSHHIQEIIDHLNAHHIEILFPETNVSRDSIKKIVSSCKRSGIEVKVAAEALYGDALGPKGSEGETYYKMLEHNARTISKNLQ